MQPDDQSDQHQQNNGNNFESLQERFKHNIYGTTKGWLRLDLLNEDFKEIVIPRLTQASRILDVGCGEARISLPLINFGHRLTLLDSSEQVLKLVRSRLEAQEMSTDRVAWYSGSLLSHLPLLEEKFDLVVMHAVMEWLEDPWQGLQLTLGKVTEGGIFSLAFYNRNSLIYRNLLQGNFRKLKKDNWQQSSTGLTPVHPVDPEQLYLYMAQNGFELIARRGIRCFYDFMRPGLKAERSYEDVLEMERRYSKQDPFLSLGRYIHGIWQKIN